MALLKDFIAKGLLASRPAGAAGTEGQLYYVTDAAARRLTIDNGDGTWTDMVLDAAYGGGGGGTVTSVALTVPADLAVAGSPITGAGTLAITRATQSANFGLFGPTTGAADVPAYRALVDADIPNVLTTQDDLIVGGAAGARTRLGKGTDGQVLTVDPATHHLIWATPAAPGTGTVTSVALSTPGVLYSVSGSPITGAGTLALALINQSANQVLGGPVSGPAAAPAFRALVDADIPNVLTTQDDLVIGGAAGARTRLAKGADGQVLTVDPATHHLVWATPASGSGTVTSVSGTAPVAVATGTTTPVISVPAFVASGASHAAGLVPDPGAAGGTTKFLREDATWAVPAGGGSGALTQIAQTVLGGSAASIVFSSIPGTYTHLLVLWTLRSDNAGTGNTEVDLRLNADTGAHYDNNHAFSGTSGISPASAAGVTFFALGFISNNGNTAGMVGSGHIYIHDYARTTFWRSIVAQGGLGDGTTQYITWAAGRWKDTTSAVTTVTLFPASGNFLTGSIATLYGLS